MLTTFTLMIENAEGTSQTVVMEADLPTAGTHFLDKTEQALLRVFHSLPLEPYRRQAEPMTRQLAETAQTQYGGTLLRSPHPYRIDREMGWISLDPYGLQNEKRVVWTPKADGFPTLRLPQFVQIVARLVFVFCKVLDLRAHCKVYCVNGGVYALRSLTPERSAAALTGRSVH